MTPMRFRISTFRPLVCLCLAAAMWLNAAWIPRIQAGPLEGICYGPFRSGQSPGEAYPAESQIRADLQIIRSIAPTIRTYGNEAILAEIPRLCSEQGLKCYAGAWIGTSETANIAQITNLVRIGKSYSAAIKGLVVGNEVLLNGYVSKARLIDYLGQVRLAVSLPVTTAEPWHIWNDAANADLAAAVDFIMIHVHPYWESPYWSPNLTVTNAARHVADRYNQIKAKYPGKKVVIGETGWPTAGGVCGAAVPNEANQKRFLRELKAKMAAAGAEYLFFEAFDEPYKSNEGAVGPHWGACYDNRLMKPGLKNLLYHDGKSKLAVYDDALGNWYLGTVEGNALEWKLPWGSRDMTPVGGDYDKDGVPDLAVYSERDGAWYIRTVTGKILVWDLHWGGPGLMPVAGDYDGDDRADLAVYNRAAGEWYVRTLSGTVLAWKVKWGGTGLTPVHGDYNGDRRSDLAVYMRSNGEWCIRTLAGLTLAWKLKWGGVGLQPIAGDFNGDGANDIAVYQSATGKWWIRTLAGAILASNLSWGSSEATAFAGDYNGDGRDDLAIYYKTSGTWFIRSLTGATLAWNVKFGGSGLTPLEF